MSQYVLFQKSFWADTLERTVATAAQAVAATWGADVVYPDAFTLDYKVLAGVAAGGALAALVKQVAKLGLTAQVPTPLVPTDEQALAYLKATALPAALKKSGGDVERQPTDYDYQAAPGVAPIIASTPVTDETMGLD